MSSDESYFDFLKPGEKVVDSLTFTKGDIVATDRRLVIRRQQSFGQNVQHDDFDYRYIAHIFIQNKSYTIHGVATIVLGLLFARVKIIATVILGVIGFFIMRYQRHVLIINLSGVQRPFEYSLTSSNVHLVQNLVSSVVVLRSNIK
jgi:hypothetical protein